MRNKRNKTYSFDDTHDPTLPAAMWFQESEEGLVLFIVLYSLACRWGRCLGCNLPSQSSSRHVPYRPLIAQIDSVFNAPQVIERSERIGKVILSNNGSILDEDTFSSTALMYFLARLNLGLPNLSTLCIETRPEYVDFAELEFLARALDEGETPTRLELGIGFEAFDDRVRNEVFDKGMTLATFEKLVRSTAPYGYGLKCYFMQKPIPRMSDREGVEDIHRAIDYLSDVVERFEARINMHLNPTFVARGTALEEAFRQGEYQPPTLLDVARAAQHARGKNISIFIGLSDEGLAVEGGSFLRPEETELVPRLELFNREQDFDILDEVAR